MKIILYRFLSAFLFLGLINSFSACKEKKPEESKELEELGLSYASGFTISKGNHFWEVEVTNAWTGADRVFRYLILEPNAEKPEGNFDAVIQLPVKRVVLTSTTQIPHLDLLNEMNLLVGFPNHDLISSANAWALIDAGADRKSVV